MVLGKLIQRIQSRYSKGVQSDDTRLSSRDIYSMLLTARNRLIVQSENKHQKLSQWNYQTLKCIALVEAPIHECPCIPTLGSTIYRTKYKLPSVLTDLNKHLIQSVTSIDGSIRYGEITWEDKKYKSDDKYTSNKPDYFIRGGYLYITDSTEIEVITISALFQDPLEAHEYVSYCSTCNTNDLGCTAKTDLDFPVDSDLEDVLVEMVLQELGIFIQGKEDTTSDSRDNPSESNK